MKLFFRCFVFTFTLVSLNVYGEWERKYIKDDFTDKERLLRYATSTNTGNKDFLGLECNEKKEFYFFYQVAWIKPIDFHIHSGKSVEFKIRIDSGEILTQIWTWRNNFALPNKEQVADLLQRMKGAKKFAIKLGAGGEADSGRTFNIDGFDQANSEVQNFCK